MLRNKVISLGLMAFQASQLHNLLRPFTQGRGVILMFHHVRPWTGNAFAPNRLLEITPQFLDIVLCEVKAAGFEILSMDEALSALARPKSSKVSPFAVLTFDDGYRDNVEFALPVLEHHSAPFTLYVTTGFAARTTPLWWRDLEAAVRILPDFKANFLPSLAAMPNHSPVEKTKAFETIYWALRKSGEAYLRSKINCLAGQAGVNSSAIVEELCLDWPGIDTLARHPLCTIGVHTLTHPMLAQIGADAAQHELEQSRAIIEAKIGVKATHLSYPVGDRTSAGSREFAMAQDLGFTSAVTTRPGMVLDAHQNRLLALPRLSINGNWQQRRHVNVLLSGAPFAFINKFQAG